MNDLDYKKKYEAELNEINKRLAAIDDERARLVRVGVRLEGALAHINDCLREKAAAPESASTVETPASEPAAA